MKTRNFCIWRDECDIIGRTLFSLEIISKAFNREYREVSITEMQSYFKSPKKETYFLYNPNYLLRAFSFVTNYPKCYIPNENAPCYITSDGMRGGVIIAPIILRDEEVAKNSRYIRKVIFLKNTKQIL